MFQNQILLPRPWVAFAVILFIKMHYFLVPKINVGYTYPITVNIADPLRP